MDNAQAQSMVLGWQRTIDTLHQQLSSAPQASPGFWDNVANGAGNLLAGAVNGAASLGNALATDPLAAAELIGGGVAGLAMEGAGAALDATGVGALGGVPLNVAGAAVMADGARRALTDAFQNPVQPMQVNAKTWGQRYDDQKEANEKRFNDRADKDGNWDPDDNREWGDNYGKNRTDKMPELKKRWFK